MTQPLQAFANVLGQKIGLPLEVSPNGSLFLSLGEQGLLLQTVNDGQSVLLYAEVGAPTTFGRGDVLSALLAGNLFLMETKGAALSYDQYNEMVGLNLVLPLEGLEAEAFANAVDNLILTALAWREELQRLNQAAEDKFTSSLAVAESLEDETAEPEAENRDLAAYMLKV